MDDAAQVKLLTDLENLSRMELRQKYRGEASTHGNMKARVKTRAAKVHDEFQSFRDFLRHVGPKPTTKATLDRIDNTDPEYAPGKVRWADKQTQNRNKGDSLIFHCPKSGRYYTASQLAGKQQVTPTAVRNRRRQGWTDAEIVAGCRALTAPVRHRRSRSACPPARRGLQSAAEIQFMRDREYCERHRIEEGEEYFITTPVEMQQVLAEDFPRFCGEDWLRQAENDFLQHKLTRWWRQFKPHVNFLALRPHQQAWILRIDPEQARRLRLTEVL